MFKPLVSNYDVKQLNDFSKAMLNIRKGAITAKQKNDALKKQIDYFNLMTKTNFQYMNKPPKFLFSTKPINLLSKADTNALWKHLKPRGVRSKKGGLSLWNQMYMILDYLGFSRPRVARNGAPAAGAVARRSGALAAARGVGRAAAFARAEAARKQRSGSAGARLSGHRPVHVPPIPSGSVGIRQHHAPIDLQAIERQQGSVINLDNMKPPSQPRSKSQPRDEDDEKGESLNNKGVAEPPAPRAEDYGVYNQFESAPANESEEQRAARLMRNRVALFKSSDKYRRGRRNNNQNDVAVQSKNKSKGKIGGNDNYFNFNQDDASDGGDSDFDIDLSGLPPPNQNNNNKKSNEKPSKKPVAQGYYNYEERGFRQSDVMKPNKKPNKKQVNLSLPSLGDVDDSIQVAPPSSVIRPNPNRNRDRDRSVSAQSILPRAPRKKIQKGSRNQVFNFKKPKTWHQWTDQQKKDYRKKSKIMRGKQRRFLDNAYGFKPSPAKDSSMLY